MSYAQRSLESISGYWTREKERQRAEELGREARQMLGDIDFEDRLLLFMCDLWDLSHERSLEDLPYYGKYFESEEIKALARYSRINDPNATPNEILVSLEEYFPSCRVQVLGKWKPHHEGYIRYLRNDKEVMPGTLKSPYADLMKEIRKETEAAMREEEEKERKILQKKKETAEKRKKTRERRKLEMQAAKLRESESTSDTPEATMSINTEGSSTVNETKEVSASTSDTPERPMSIGTEANSTADEAKEEIPEEKKQENAVAPTSDFGAGKRKIEAEEMEPGEAPPRKICRIKFKSLKPQQ